MIKQLISVECIDCCIENLKPLQEGMVFYEVKIPDKYIEFDRFYIFSNIIPEANSGRIYFQNAASKLKQAIPQDFYKATAKNVPYDGIRQAISNCDRSTICISDPGIFIEDKVTSWYSVVNQVDICFYIAQFLSHWLKSASLEPKDVLMFGSSAGSFGALRTATFLDKKTNVMSINGQIKRAFNYKNNQSNHDLLDYYQQCLQQQKIMPNIYLLCNYRDKNTLLNQKLFALITNYDYEKQGTYRPNVVFDLYDGFKGHLRPRKYNLLQKIDIAEAVMKSSQEEQDFQRNQEQIESTMEELQKKIKLKPNQSSLYRSLAKLQAQQKQFEPASINYRKAIELDPEQPAWVYQYLARVSSQLERLDEAIDLYQQAIKLQPNQSSLYRNLAKLQAQQEQFEPASINYHKAIELDPEQPAWVYRFLEKTGNAR